MHSLGGSEAWKSTAPVGQFLLMDLAKIFHPTLSGLSGDGALWLGRDAEVLAVAGLSRSFPVANTEEAMAPGPASPRP